MTYLKLALDTLVFEVTTDKPLEELIGIGQQNIDVLRKKWIETKQAEHAISNPADDDNPSIPEEKKVHNRNTAVAKSDIVQMYIN